MKNKNNLTLMQTFNIAVSESVQYKEGLEDIGDYKYYYPRLYGERIKQFLKELNVSSKEDSKNSFNSAASSARLCTNQYYEEAKQKSVEFEKPIYNDVSGTPTKMDAVDGLTFIECKCQEIVNGEHELLRKSYYTKASSKLFRQFNVSNVVIEKHINSKGNHDYDYCDFSLKDLGINYPGKYYEINFNVKQLICHLIAIAHDYSDDDKKTLRYVVFKPKKEIIEESSALQYLYAELDEQFKAIVGSEKIQRFLLKHNIELRMEYIYIDEVKEHFGNSDKQ